MKKGQNYMDRKPSHLECFCRKKKLLLKKMYLKKAHENHAVNNKKYIFYSNLCSEDF